MVTGSTLADRWVALADAPDSDRSTQMRPLLDEVLALDEGARPGAVKSMVEAEYGLEDARLRSFTLSRLRAWLALAATDLPAAQTLARGYDAAFDGLSGELAMRRSTVVQTVAIHDLRPEEVTGLFDLIPSIVRQVPKAIPPTQQYAKKSDEPKKPFWKFW